MGQVIHGLFYQSTEPMRRWIWNSLQQFRAFDFFPSCPHQSWRSRSFPRGCADIHPVEEMREFFFHAEGFPHPALVRSHLGFRTVKSCVSPIVLDSSHSYCSDGTIVFCWLLCGCPTTPIDSCEEHFYPFRTDSPTVAVGEPCEPVWFRECTRVPIGSRC